MNTITVVTQKQGKTLSGVILSVKESTGEGCPDWESGFSIPYSASTTLQLRKRPQKQLRTLENLESNLGGGVLEKLREGPQVRDLGGPSLSSPRPTSSRVCWRPFWSHSLSSSPSNVCVGLTVCLPQCGVSLSRCVTLKLCVSQYVCLSL